MPRGFNTNGRDGVDFIVLELEPGAVDAKKSFLRDLEEFVVREIFVMFPEGGVGGVGLIFYEDVNVECGADILEFQAFHGVDNGVPFVVGRDEDGDLFRRSLLSCYGVLLGKELVKGDNDVRKKVEAEDG